MADNKTNYAENATLNAWLRATNLTAPVTVYIGLHTAQADPENGSVTEVAVGGYARQAIGFAAPSGGVCASNADVVYPVASAPQGIVIGWGIYDAVAAGNLIYYGTLTVPKTINTNDQFKFLAGSVNIGEL